MPSWEMSVSLAAAGRDPTLLCESCISFTASLCCFLCWKVGMMAAGVLGLQRQTDRRCLGPEANPEELTHCYLSLKPTLKEPWPVWLTPL